MNRSGGGGGSGGGTANRDPSRIIHIANIPLETTELELRRLLSTCGQIISFEFESSQQQHQRNMGSSGTRIAKCEYPDGEIAKVAVSEFDGHIISGKTLVVRLLTQINQNKINNHLYVIGSNAQRDMTTRNIQAQPTALQGNTTTPTTTKNINSISDQYIKSLVGNMTEKEQAELLCEFKHIATNHPEQMHQLLSESPQFAHAILTLLTMFQFVDTKVVDGYLRQRVDQATLTPDEHGLYEKWKTYTEEQRQNLREKLGNPNALNDNKLKGIATIFKSLQDKLGVKL